MLPFLFSSRRRHTRLQGDWSSDVCSSDLDKRTAASLGERFDLDIPASIDGRAAPGTVGQLAWRADAPYSTTPDRKSTRLNSSHLVISYAVFCLKKKTTARRARLGRGVAGP